MKVFTEISLNVRRYIFELPLWFRGRKQQKGLRYNTGYFIQNLGTPKPINVSLSSRPTHSQPWSLKIRLTAFLNCTKIPTFKGLELWKGRSGSPSPLIALPSTLKRQACIDATASSSSSSSSSIRIALLQYNDQAFKAANIPPSYNSQSSSRLV